MVSEAIRGVIEEVEKQENVKPFTETSVIYEDNEDGERRSTNIIIESL